MDRLGELARVIEVGGLGLHPEQVGEGRRRKRLGDGVRNTAAHLVVPFGRPGRLAVPVHVDAEFVRLLAGGVERGARGEAPPVVDACLDGFTFARLEFDHFGNRLPKGVHCGVVLPGVEEAGGDPLEHRVDRGLFPLSQRRHGFGGLRQDAPALQPFPCDGVLSGRYGVQEMAGEFSDPQLVKMLDQRQEARLVGWHVRVGRANQEGLIPFIAPTFDQVGGFGVGAGDDEAGNAHDVELKAGRVQSLVLLVLRHKHFAALMAALLGARTLVLDVVARNASFHEAANQVAHVWIATVAGVGVSDDEWPKIPSVRRGALRLSHSRTQILLVAIRRE